MSTETPGVQGPQPLVHFYMAEDFRRELNGKLSAIGLYPDHVVVLQLPESLPDPSPQNPLTIRSLAFAFSVVHLSGDALISIDVESNGVRSPLVPQDQFAWPGEGHSVNLLAAIEPWVVQQLGVRELVLTLNGAEHRFRYELRRATIKPPASKTRLKGAKSPARPSRAGTPK